MTYFSTDQHTEQPDQIFVEVDRRFNVALVRTATGIEIRVYPRSGGELWDFPFETFFVDEREIVDLEGELPG